MIELILFLVSTMGLTHIIVDSKIAEAPVEWIQGKLPEKFLWFHPRGVFDCHQCMGFWVGMFSAIFWQMPFLHLNATTVGGYVLCAIASLVKLVLCGCAGSVVSLWVGHYFTYLQAQAMIDLDGLEEDNGN